MNEPIDAGWTIPVLTRVDISCPGSLGELLAQAATGRRPVAGGTDLLVAAAHEGREPSRLVWTGSVPELTIVERCGGDVRVGSAASLGHVAAFDAVRTGAPAIAEAAEVVGSVQIRNVATLAGNLCNASPAADTVPPLAIHDAQVEISHDGAVVRTVAAEVFAEGPGRTVLSEGEVLTAISFRPLGPGEASAYQRFTVRKSMDLAFVGVAARVRLEEDGRTIHSAKIALGAVAPTVVIAREAAATLADTIPDEDVLRSAGRAAAAACEPITDLRASAEYRRRLVEVLTGDVVMRAWRRARGDGP